MQLAYFHKQSSIGPRNQAAHELVLLSLWAMDRTPKSSRELLERIQRLQSEQKERVFNGCGPQTLEDLGFGWQSQPLSWKDPCLVHDFLYSTESLGHPLYCDKITRETADEWLRKDLIVSWSFPLARLCVAPNDAPGLDVGVRRPKTVRWRLRCSTARCVSLGTNSGAKMAIPLRRLVLPGLLGLLRAAKSARPQRLALQVSTAVLGEPTLVGSASSSNQRFDCCAGHSKPAGLGHRQCAMKRALKASLGSHCSAQLHEHAQCAHQVGDRSILFD